MLLLIPIIPWIIGLFGLIVGSFLNVVVLREGSTEGLGGRSHCVGCKKTLQWYELIPVASFLIQRGKCRNCHMKISWQYPIVEALTATTFFFVGRFITMHHISWIASLFLLISVSFAIAIAVYDLRTKLVPTLWYLGWVISGLLFIFMITLSIGSLVPTLWLHIQGVLVATPFFLLWLISRGRWMGFADIEIIAWMGAFFGLFSGISAVLIAFYLGGLFGIMFVLYQLARGKTYASIRRIQVPFAQFLLFEWFGTLIWSWNNFALFARLWM